MPSNSGCREERAGVPRARRCWGRARRGLERLHGAVPPLRRLPLSGLRARLLMGDEGRGRQRFIQRSVFPWPEPAGFHICTDVLSSPRLRKQRRALCSQLPWPRLLPEPRSTAVSEGVSLKPALAFRLSPAGWHRRRACPGWLVTLARLEAEPQPRGDKVLPATAGCQEGEGQQQHKPGCFTFQMCMCVCIYIFIYFYVCVYIYTFFFSCQTHLGVEQELYS